VTIDTSGLTIEEVVDRMLRTIERKAAAAR
jgi:cytidylate kinase